jgi:acetyltransferase-like isoleucine patch superfamily enzyme
MFQGRSDFMNLDASQPLHRRPDPDGVSAGGAPSVIDAAGSRVEGGGLRNLLERLRRKHFEWKNRRYIARLRRRGVRIGEGCIIFSRHISTEPYLVELGDRVVIAAGVQFVTHNGLSFRLRHTHPDLQVFGPIRIGSDTLVGLNAILLPGTEIGANCLVNAGAVVRGRIPDDSVVIGNPARVHGKVSDLLAELPGHPGRLDVFNLSPAERRERIERHFGLR